MVMKIKSNSQTNPLIEMLDKFLKEEHNAIIHVLGERVGFRVPYQSTFRLIDDEFLEVTDEDGLIRLMVKVKYITAISRDVNVIKLGESE